MAIYSKRVPCVSVSLQILVRDSLRRTTMALYLALAEHEDVSRSRPTRSRSIISRPTSRSSCHWRICHDPIRPALNMPATGLRMKSGRRTQPSKQRNMGREMTILTPNEKSFLDEFLHEATTSPFTGPATKAIHQIGVEYGDLSDLAWAFEQENPRTSIELGHAAAVAPPRPWANRESALRRNMEIHRIWDQQRKPMGTPQTS
jgi:hypothetical protein